MGMRCGGSLPWLVEPSEAGSFRQGKTSGCVQWLACSRLSCDVSETPEDHGCKRCCNARHIRGEIFCVRQPVARDCQSDRREDKRHQNEDTRHLMQSDRRQARGGEDGYKVENREMLYVVRKEDAGYVLGRRDRSDDNRANAPNQSRERPCRPQPKEG